MTASIRPRALALRTVAVSCAAVLAGALLTACGGSSAGSDDSITLFNGQHRADHQRTGRRVREATGIHVNVRSDDEDVLANQIALQGQNSPADVFFTENSPPLEFLAEKHLLSAVPSSTFGTIPSQYSSPQKDWIAVSGRVSVLVYNPSLIPASQLPDLGHATGRPQVQGQARAGPGRDRLPADRHLRAARLRRGQDTDLAQGDQGQRGRSHAAGQRNAGVRRQPRPGRLRPDQPVLLVPAALRDRRSARCIPRSPTSPRTTPAT